MYLSSPIDKTFFLNHHNDLVIKNTMWWIYDYSRVLTNKIIDEDRKYALIPMTVSPVYSNDTLASTVWMWWKSSSAHGQSSSCPRALICGILISRLQRLLRQQPEPLSPGSDLPDKGSFLILQPHRAPSRSSKNFLFHQMHMHEHTELSLSTPIANLFVAQQAVLSCYTSQWGGRQRGQRRSCNPHVSCWSPKKHSKKSSTAQQSVWRGLFGWLSSNSVVFSQNQNMARLYGGSRAKPVPVLGVSVCLDRDAYKLSTARQAQRILKWHWYGLSGRAVGIQRMSLFILSTWIHTNYPNSISVPQPWQLRHFYLLSHWKYSARIIVLLFVWPHAGIISGQGRLVLRSNWSVA